MKDDDKEKLETLRAAYAAQPHDPQTASRLAEHYTDLGWYNEALDVYREALEKNPDDFSLLLGYGNTLYRHKESDEALNAFKKLSLLRPGRIEGWNNAGIVEMTRGTIAAAIVDFKKVLETEPDNAGALLNLGNCYAQQGDTAEARRLFERAIAVRPDYADAWFNLGNAYLAGQEFSRAKSSFEKALRYQREFPAALKNMGFVHEQLREWEMAASCYRRAANLDKTDAGLQINLANVLLACDNVEEAKECFLKAVKLAPKNSAGWQGLRRCALIKGDLATYLRATSAILSYLDDATVARSVEILLDLNHPEEARTLIAGADAYRKKNDALDAQRLLVYRHYAENAEEQAVIYKRLSGLTAPTDQVLKALARYDYLTGNFVAVRRRIVALHRTDAAAQVLLVRSLVAMDKKEEARALLMRAMAEWPENGDLLFLRALLAADGRDRADAAAYLVRALENGFASVHEINAHPGLKQLFGSLAAGRPCADRAA
jgi:tetratricopeptide (TPR) repeat protein